MKDARLYVCTMEGQVAMAVENLTQVVVQNRWMKAHLMHISKAELQNLVCEDAAGISKTKQGVICEHDLQHAFIKQHVGVPM